MNPTAPVVVDGLWLAVWKLSRMNLGRSFSSFRRAKLSRKILTIVGVLVVVGLMVGAYVLGGLAMRFLTSNEAKQQLGDVAPLLEALPSLIFIAAFLFMFIISFGILLQALYLAGDMEFLLSAPVPIRAVFLTKLFQAILPELALIEIIGIPILFSLGAALSLNPVYYGIVVLLLAVIPLTASGLSSLGTMALVRIIPAKRVAEILAFVGGITSFVCSQTGNLMRFAQSDNQKIFDGIQRLHISWLPLDWGGRGLVELGRGQWASGAFFVALALLASLAIFAGSLLAAEKLYYSGWATMQGVPRRKKAPRSMENNLKNTSAAGPLPAPIRALVIKDLRLIWRDLKFRSELITPLIFGIVYFFILIRGRGGANVSEDKLIASYGVVGLSMFTGWMLLERLVLTAFSREGKEYWLLKSAPLSPGQLLAGKYLAAYLPALAVGWLYLIITSFLRPPGVVEFIAGLLSIGMNFAGLAGLLLYFGVLGAKFDWQDPRQMTSTRGSCLGMIISFAFMLTSAALFFLPAPIIQALGGDELTGRLIGVAIGGIFCLTVGYVMPQLAYGKVVKLNEE